ncbi:MAG: flavin reductase [Absicoccus porci]|jgi:flavin reductase (DIM6/NTAB) family NADH-FMN oxidoreductase RutF|uniref:flavin reductase n=1 Tax=Absicoccus porci TaxID=2486576 RepID=UPI00156A648F|nr:flavin reductase [Absicoccus porci]MDD6460101.1 flavin reductase [Absicoccus porci]MDD7330533.1 flavin reductase [Absicoccus porci]MDY4737870.1 flavin reductase [Absicoccus porci]MEE1355750.1 flavin reductase [Absicoccus porci]
MNLDVMKKLTYGLFVLTARDGQKDNGCIINTAVQVASEPNTISISVNKANYTHDMILKTGKFNVSILSEEAKFDTFKHFGFQSGRDVDKFAEVEISRADNGIAIIHNEQTNGYLSGKVIQSIDLGSHTLFIATVEDGEVWSDTPSTTYAYYFANIKPKPQPKPKQKGWICTICGYIYEGEVLPDDFICPVCKHPASDFRPL